MKATLTTYSTKCDDGTLFLGDGSLAGLPTPKLGGKGIRPVIKVVDDKCLYVYIAQKDMTEANELESLILLRTIPFINSLDQLFRTWARR